MTIDNIHIDLVTYSRVIAEKYENEKYNVNEYWHGDSVMKSY